MPTLVLGAVAVASAALALAVRVAWSERQQREQDQIKHRVLGILSHELRTPLNAIQGFGSILEDELDGPLNERQRQHMRRILTASDALLSLVDDLLVMSSIQAGQLHLHLAPVCLEALLTGVVGALRPKAEYRRQRLVTELPPRMPGVVGDSQRLHQVLVHLVGNAIKFAPEHGTIVVGARVEEDGVRIEVRDDGPGLDPASISRLFEPFTQLDMSATRTVGGVGLGLAIARALIQAHGGQIGVESAPGHGATFWFFLPASQTERSVRLGPDISIMPDRTGSPTEG